MKLQHGVIVLLLILIISICLSKLWRNKTQTINPKKTIYSTFEEEADPSAFPDPETDEPSPKLCYEMDEPFSIPDPEGGETSAIVDYEVMEEIIEDAPCSLENIIGIGGGAGNNFRGRGNQIKSLSHGGTRLTNEAAYDLQFFKNHGVNPMVDTDDDPLSTFAADVDTGSYTICRRSLLEGNPPNKDAVRVEEFINYFDYNYAAPLHKTFAAHMETGPSPFAPNRRLLVLGLKGKEISTHQRKDAILTFVIDVSGSMDQDNRLGLVKKTLELLVDQLRPQDKIGIAIYGSQGSALLEHTHVTEGEGKAAILSAIRKLTPQGSTNAEEGLTIGYNMAEKAFYKQRINRVILCSDGVANVGRTGPDTIMARIKAQVKKGIYLTTVGFGMDNYNDLLMEQLGNKGNGHYAYVDDIKEARRIFVEGLCGTLQIIARDLKLQVEFNPKKVRSYRLVGYENRRVRDEDFRNKKADGGEVGAGHSVTAVYEIKLWEKDEGSLGVFRIRYKNPDYSDEVSEYAAEIKDTERDPLSPSFCLASCVVQFAEILRESYWAKDLPLANALAMDLPKNEKVKELRVLMQKAADLKQDEHNETAMKRVDLNEVK